jgi:glycosyltransferase involved in cell wall biosynthesis
MKKVVIVMPAYFAQKTLEKTFLAIPKELRNPKNIILVDDASRDDTVKIAQKLGLKVFIHKKNTGYGGNQKTCYKEALKLNPDIVVMIHPDYQYDPSMTKELIRPIEDGWLDIMLGNRIRSRSESLAGGHPMYKYFANRILTLVENIILGRNLGEYHTGFRAYNAKVLKSLPLNKFSDDFIFDQEILVAAIAKNYKIGEISVPVKYFADASSINWVRSIKYGIETLLTLVKYILYKFGMAKFEIFD